MSDRTDDPGAPGRPRKAVLLVAAVVVVVVAIILVLVLGNRNVTGGPVPATSTGTSAAPTSAPASSAQTSASSANQTTTSVDPTATASRPTSTASSSATSTATGQPKPQTTRSPVPINTDAEVKKGLTASISKLEAVKGDANGPGEIAGPAVRFVLTLTNDSDKTVPLDTTVVNVYYTKAETPASELEKPGGKPLPASVKAGDQATGTFVFSIPKDQRDRVLITVDYSVDVSLVAFRGKAPS